MNVELQVNNSINPTARFVSWAPSPCRIRVTDPSGATAPVVNVRITGASAASGWCGRVPREHNWSVLQQPDSAGPNHWRLRTVFRRRQVRAAQRQQRRRENRSPQRNHVGRLGTGDGARPKERQRTDAGERDRFVSAFAQLNNQGAGRFADFRDMHTAVSSPQAHGAPGFLPWHRAYLLDLERELQAIDPSVSLPYWRFDQPAPNIFTREFFGVSDPIGTVQFSATNPLQFWRTDGVQGINRRPFFNTGCSAAWSPHRGADAGPWQSVPSVPDHGRQPARISAHQLRRFHLQHRHRRARSAVLPASLQRRSALGEVAATEWPLRSGAGGLVRQQSRESDRPQPA